MISFAYKILRVSKAFYEFIKTKYNERKVFTYGMGGVVFVLNENSL